jgi:hypothetical protein
MPLYLSHICVRVFDLPSIDYYMSMAPLVLEESRCIIAESLTNISRNKRDGCTFSVELLSIEEKYPNLAGRQRQNAPLILNFLVTNESKKQYVNDISAKWMRPGSVFLLRRQNKHSSDSETSVLGCIIPNGNRQSESTSSSSSFSLMIFRRDDIDLEHLDAPNPNNKLFCVTSLTTLISHVRQMEACLRMSNVSFMRKLLGQKNSTHIRFDNSLDEEEEEELVVCDIEDDAGGNALKQGVYLEGEDTITASSSSSSISEADKDVGAKDCNESLSGLLANIPTLNETQERAAKTFLDSPTGSLVLVQG